MLTATTSAVAPDSLRASVQAARGWLGRFPLPLIELMARVGIAAVFWRSGMNKIESFESTVMLFRDEYRVPVLPPDIAAYLATAAELTCPILIVLGIAARFGAASLLGMTLVIQLFVYPESWTEHLLWASILTYILTRGPGTISVDHFIARRFLGPDRRR